MTTEEYLFFLHTGTGLSIFLFLSHMVFERVHKNIKREALRKKRQRDEMNNEVFLSSLKKKSSSALYILSRLIIFKNFSCQLEYQYTRDEAFPAPIGGYSQYFVEGLRELFETSVPDYTYKSEEGGECFYEEKVKTKIWGGSHIFGEVEITFDEGGFEIYLIDDSLHKTFLLHDIEFLDYLMERFRLGEVSDQYMSSGEASLDLLKSGDKYVGD